MVRGCKRQGGRHSLRLLVSLLDILQRNISLTLSQRANIMSLTGRNGGGPKGYAWCATDWNDAENKWHVACLEGKVEVIP
jgi:hypothetical protein